MSRDVAQSYFQKRRALGFPLLHEVEERADA
jgi:hypothetical protein